MVNVVRAKAIVGSPWSTITVTGCVSCWTLPDLFDVCELDNVSLVKMDIEGGETDVLPVVCPFLAELEIPLLVSMHLPLLHP